MPDLGPLVLVEIGQDFHRQLFLMSREDRLLVAVALLCTCLHEYAPPVREFAFQAAQSRATAALPKEGLAP